MGVMEDSNSGGGFRRERCGAVKTMMVEGLRWIVRMTRISNEGRRCCGGICSDEQGMKDEDE
ncbi:hypothetical protein SESBI_11711 [Sesbania bispinosa]|nr:hypothetical protein SESBI_11711 [Sesbania bispinosa]